mgnify:CR=1 FL=1
MHYGNHAMTAERTAFSRRVQTSAGRLLRLSLALIYTWFGVLKLFGLSPADALVARTVTFIPFEVFFPLLGVWETAIGLGFLFPRTTPIALVLMALQMPGTFLPLLMAPDVVFTRFPIGLTLEGQYIVKNLVLIAAGIAVWAEGSRRADSVK